MWKDKSEFKEAVKAWADKLNVKANSIALRPMKNKWASCSTKGNLNFNEELLELEKHIGNYVIVHELLHFRYPNHGRVWKSLMTVYLGEYEIVEARLKKIVSSTKKYNNGLENTTLK
jgi:predicted metal-dependent hydrolase